MSDVFSKEKERLLALRNAGLSSGPRSMIFSRLVQMAAESFQVPIATISLIERDRQVYFEAVGTDLCGTSRRDALCSQTISVDRSVIILDASLDPNWQDNPLVTDAPRIRFYASCPLHFQDQPIGTLCLIDPRPRNRFSEKERVRFERFGAIVEELFELHALRAEQGADATRFERMAATIPDALIIACERGNILSWNPGAERLFGYAAREAAKLTVADLLPGRLRYASWQFREMFDPYVGTTQDITALLKDGTTRAVEFSLTMWSENGRPIYGAVVRDVSERKALEERLYRLAHRDPLTELPNRTVFRARVRDALAGNGRACVMLADLDGFKDVNDTFGHVAGDEVLRIASARILACIEPTDTVARLGGDEFVVLLPDCADPLRAGAIGNRIVQAMAEPFEIDGGTAHLGVSVGVALGQGHADSPDELLNSADLALYKAKSEGRHCSRLFTPGMRDASAAQARFKQEIRRAVEKQEFVLFYQPQMRLSDGSLIGAEALIRWQHPEYGLLQPGTFLSALTTSRYAADVAAWVLRTACRQAERWRRRGHSDFRIAVNTCASQFRSGNIARDTLAVLEETGLPARNLELEITENIVLGVDPHFINPLFTLREAGIGIAFDDYGTGYASLSVLKDYPLTRLKIDRSFVRQMTEVADVTIIRAILHLAKGFGLQVVAEGIETQDQLDRLVKKGCAEGQGYLFGKPMPADIFEALFIETHARRTAAGSAG